MNNDNISDKLLITQAEPQIHSQQRSPKCKNPAYKRLRKDIIFFCTKIENSLTNMFNNNSSPRTISNNRNNNNNNNNNNTYIDNTNDNIQSPRSIHNKNKLAIQLNKYKTLTKDIEEQIDGIYKMGKVIDIEKTIQLKIKIYNDLKNENNILKQIYSQQSKVIKDYEQKTSKTSDIETLLQKISSNKSEVRSLRDSFLQSEKQIRTQLTQINMLHNKLNNIKQNIKFMKEEKEYQQFQIDEQLKQEEIINEMNLEKDNVFEFIRKENEINNLKQFKNERKVSLNKLKKEDKLKEEEQLNVIERLVNEIKLLNDTAYKKEYEKRIEEHKIKLRLRKELQQVKLKSVFNKNGLICKNESSRFNIKKGYNNKPFDNFKGLNDNVMELIMMVMI